jgi:hypothetical protein
MMRSSASSILTSLVIALEKSCGQCALSFLGWAKCPENGLTISYQRNRSSAYGGACHSKRTRKRLSRPSKLLPELRHKKMTDVCRALTACFYQQADPAATGIPMCRDVLLAGSIRRAPPWHHRTTFRCDYLEFSRAAMIDIMRQSVLREPSTVSKTILLKRAFR